MEHETADQQPTTPEDGAPETPSENQPQEQPSGNPGHPGQVGEPIPAEQPDSQ